LLPALDTHEIFPIVLEFPDCCLLSCYLCKIHYNLRG